MLLDRIHEGGLFFMVPIVFLLITILLLTVFGIVKKDKNKKVVSLIGSLSFFVLVWGFLGQAIGLIGAFDAIESIGNISAEILAGGLKLTLLPVVFGMFAFLIGRVSIIILTLLRKE